MGRFTTKEYSDPHVRAAFAKQWQMDDTCYGVLHAARTAMPGAIYHEGNHRMLHKESINRTQLYSRKY